MNNKQIIEYTRKILTEGIEQLNNENHKSNVKPEQMQETPPSTPYIINNITVSPKHHFEVIILCLFICLYPFLEYYRPSKNFTEEQIKHTINQFQPKHLSLTEINEFQELVKATAVKENRTPQSVHRELKKIYNYQRYKDITQTLYLEIKKYLQTRLQEEDSVIEQNQSTEKITPL